MTAAHAPRYIPFYLINERGLANLVTQPIPSDVLRKFRILKLSRIYLFIYLGFTLNRLM